MGEKAQITLPEFLSRMAAGTATFTTEIVELTLAWQKDMLGLVEDAQAAGVSHDVIVGAVIGALSQVQAVQAKISAGAKEFSK